MLDYSEIAKPLITFKSFAQAEQEAGHFLPLPMPSEQAAPKIPSPIESTDFESLNQRRITNIRYEPSVDRTFFNVNGNQVGMPGDIRGQLEDDGYF